mgnify:CR=1 FL=1
MVEIRPFHGFHYDMRAASAEASDLMAPPYDVISNRLLARLKRNPHNIVNITLGKIDGSYSHAAHLLRSWIRDGIVRRDERECLYVYDQSFSWEGRIYCRTALLAATMLEPMGQGILPHELTHPKAKQDRMDNLREIRGNIEQVFLIYDDSRGSIMDKLEEAKKPENSILSFVDFDDVSHRIFRISDPGVIDSITKELRGRSALIADGHHRYETALEYARKMDEENGQGGHDFILTALVCAHDPGLLMLPTYRLLHSLNPRLLARLPIDLKKRFDVEEIDDRIALSERLSGEDATGALGFWLTESNRGLLALLKPQFHPKDPLKNLDVFILHEFVLEDLLGLTPEMQDRKESIDYVKNTEDAFREAENGGYQVICMLNPPTIPEVMDIARSGRKMPHKSTFFYPKLWSGLVMYMHEDRSQPSSGCL